MKFGINFCFTFLFVILISSANFAQGGFIHTVNETGPNSYTTTLDHVKLNGRSNVKLFVSPVGSANSMSQIGVHYANGRWHIFHQAKNAMRTGMKFNIVYINPDNRDGFIHKVKRTNTFGFISKIDHPEATNPNARIFINTRYTITDQFFSSPVGVLFMNNQWYIVNLTKKPLPFDLEFNVYIQAPGDTNYARNTMRFEAQGTLNSHIEKIEHQAFSGNDEAVLMATNVVVGTQNYNPSMLGFSFISNNWYIVNGHATKVRDGAKFNIFSVSPLTVSTR